jgi:hypothetical protein
MRMTIFNPKTKDVGETIEVMRPLSLFERFVIWVGNPRQLPPRESAANAVAEFVGGGGARIITFKVKVGNRDCPWLFAS